MRRALLSDAYLTAMRRLDATCAERSEAWEAQARERLDAAVSTSVEALDSVEAGYRQWVAASRQVALATDARTRRKGGAPVDVTLDLRSGAEAPRMSEVLAALRRLAAPSVEREPVAVE